MYVRLRTGLQNVSAVASNQWNYRGNDITEITASRLEMLHAMPGDSIIRRKRNLYLQVDFDLGIIERPTC